MTAISPRLFLFSLMCLCFCGRIQAQITDLVVLNDAETSRLRALIATDPQVATYRDSLLYLAETALRQRPRPLAAIQYEGLLDTDPRRIETVKSFGDIDNLVNLVYGSYCIDRPEYGKKARQLALSWAKTYLPDGNPINENKLTAIFWAYHLFQGHFSKKEKRRFKAWMRAIAQAEIDRENIPNNNWEAKRLKLTGTIGCLLGDEALKNYAIEGFKTYISTAYFPDGTSNDLHQRDALHYHLSGITPCLATFINLSGFDARFDLFAYVSESGASLQKSVEYAAPYATGEKVREEWTHSKAAIDKKRAEAGLSKYQPGVLFDPRQAIPLFEWAAYYDRDWYSIVAKDRPASPFTATWIGLLNSPLVRGK